MRTVAAPLDEMVLSLLTLGKAPWKNHFLSQSIHSKTSGSEAR